MSLTFKVRNDVITILYSITRRALIILFLSISGCVSPESNQWIRNQNCLLFIEIEDTSLEKELACQNITKQEMVAILLKLNLSNEEIRHIETDPFHNDSYCCVKFFFICSPEYIASYYSNIMKQQGWRFVRGIYATEYSNSNGDWLEVYEKNSAYIRIHIYGYNDSLYDNIEYPESGVRIRRIFFDFIGIKPSVFFQSIPAPKQPIK